MRKGSTMPGLLSLPLANQSALWPVPSTLPRAVYLYTHCLPWQEKIAAATQPGQKLSNAPPGILICTTRTANRQLPES